MSAGNIDKKAREELIFETELEVMKLMQESTIGFAQLTVKSLLILNGGAAVAIAAFVGASFKEGKPSVPFAPISSALLALGTGAALAVMVPALAYVAQHLFALQIEERIKSKNDGCLGYGGRLFQSLAVLVAIVSMLCFVTGLRMIASLNLG
jgi:hypothetical protein